MGEFNRHTLIQEEFRSILSSETYTLPENTHAVMVLSGHPEWDDKGIIINEASEENRARIAFGIQLQKEIAARKAGVRPEDLTEDQFYYNAPPLLLNGDTKQLPMMRELALSHGIDPDYIEEVDCGPRGKANTKTNFEVFQTKPELQAFKHITIVTTAYHVPRVYRSALKNLPKTISFDIIPLPFEMYPYSIYKLVRGEVQRIQTYTVKGDISDRPLTKLPL